MYALYASILGLALAPLCLADVCTHGMFNDLSCLADNTKAAAYCSSELVSRSLVTPSTVTVTSTQTAVQTSVVAASETASAALVTVTTIESSFVTVQATSTAYGAAVVTSLVETTATSYAATSSALGTYAVAARDASSSCDTAAASEVLTNLFPGALSTACSCIGALPTAVTETTVTTVTQVKVTAQDLAVQTTLVTGIVVYTTTVGASTDLTTLTTQATSTATATATAPAYTQVWGPESGCSDLSGTGVLQLPQLDTTDDVDQAVSQCQGNCTSGGECTSVFVQFMYADYGGVSPRWECYFNLYAFNVSEVECDRDVNTFGTAQAFEVVS